MQHKVNYEIQQSSSAKVPKGLWLGMYSLVKKRAGDTFKSIFCLVNFTDCVCGVKVSSSWKLPAQFLSQYGHLQRTNDSRLRLYFIRMY